MILFARSVAHQKHLTAIKAAKGTKKLFAQVLVGNKTYNDDQESEMKVISYERSTIGLVACEHQHPVRVNETHQRIKVLISAYRQILRSVT